MCCDVCVCDFTSKDPQAKFCSVECSNEGRNYDAVGRPRIHPGGDGWHPDAPDLIADGGWGVPKSWSEDHGYILYYWDHPAVAHGRIHEHRAVAYAMWGDEIFGKHVDHIDGNKKNNWPSNLQTLSQTDHNRKTAKHEGIAAFKKWCNEHHPEWVEEWIREREMPEGE